MVQREGKVPLMRLVPEPDVSIDEIGARIERYWGDHVELEFVKQADLERRGWRAKFSRLVQETSQSRDAGS